MNGCDDLKAYKSCEKVKTKDWKCIGKVLNVDAKQYVSGGMYGSSSPSMTIVYCENKTIIFRRAIVPVIIGQKAYIGIDACGQEWFWEHDFNKIAYFINTKDN